MTNIDRRKFLSASALAAAGLATAGRWRLAAADEPQKPSPGGEGFRGQFLRLCDALYPVVDSERKVQFYIDSYAVRGLAVAHDLTGKREYLDVCRRWCKRMVDYQDRMDPPGAYYMNYGRRPARIRETGTSATVRALPWPCRRSGSARRTRRSRPG